jgi:hypothetical protein
MLLSRRRGCLLKQRDKTDKYRQGFHDGQFYQFKTGGVGLLAVSDFLFSINRAIACT